jgi:hypothetical protein
LSWCEKKHSSGKWIGFAVVLVFEGQCVTRYDTAHGRPHRDVLGKEKGWMGREICTINLELKAAFEYAIDDLSANYKSYYAYFCVN